MTTLLVIIFIFILASVIWALYGKGEEKVKIPAEPAKEDKEDSSLRRRAADKAIEEQFPDSEAHPYRRKEDIEAIEEISKVDDDFKLPYSANEIIPEGSKYWVYNRTIVNSEIYARKGDIPTAISLYRGVYERVIDQGINAKIKANVDYLQEYQKLHQQRKGEASRQKATEKRGGEIRLSLDGPLTIPEKIQIALTQPAQDIAPKFDINKIVDDIAEKVAVKNSAESKKQQSDIQELKEKSNEVYKLKDGLLKLHEKLIDIHQEGEETKKGIEEVKSRLLSATTESGEVLPAQARFQGEVKLPADAKFQTQAGLPAEAKIQGDVKFPLETRLQTEASLSAEAKLQTETISLPEARFQKETRAPAESKFQREVPKPKKVGFPKETRKEVKEEEDEKEEIEVLSQFQKEEEFSGLSDEDIFEKILTEDTSKKKDDSFEIIGYNKKDKSPSDNITDTEQEEKQIEEEKFYRKFLRHGKRVRKELPVLKVSYDFSKLPEEFSLSKDQNILQYSFYKYKPMLEKANELIKRRNVRDAINYYMVVKDQNIPPEFKVMLGKNINELTEYIEKYLSAD